MKKHSSGRVTFVGLKSGRFKDKRTGRGGARREDYQNEVVQCCVCEKTRTDLDKFRWDGDVCPSCQD